MKTNLKGQSAAARSKINSLRTHFSVLFFIFFLWSSVGWGQSLSNYTFSSVNNGSLDPMTSATSLAGTGSLVTGYNDDYASAVTNIGFTFIYMGTPYTQFSVNSNGQLRLGTTSVGGSAISSTSSSTAIIAPMSGDNSSGFSGDADPISYVLTGSSPNRILKIQWKNFQIPYNSTGTIGGDMQVWLYETGAIDFIYGNMYNNSSLTASRSIFLSSSNTATTMGSITVGASPTFTASTTLATNSFTASSNISNLYSSSNVSRRVYKFTPLFNTTPTDPSNLTFTSVTTTTETPNWVDNSIDETFFIVTRANDASFTTGVVVTNVASTTTAGTGTAYTLAQTGLTPGTTYYYKVQAANEAGLVGSGITGSQATTAAAIYYYTGTNSQFSTLTNWNTASDGSGTSPSVLTSTDVFIVDGPGTTSGGSVVLYFPAATTNIGQLKITSNTSLTLASVSTTTASVVINGGVGDDFVIENGSSLITNSGTNAISFAFSGNGNTGDISGTYTFGGSTSNLLTTTGGTGTMVNIASTGVVNMGNTAISLVGSTTTLTFLNGSNCNVTGTTTGAYPIPLATWETNSNLTLSGAATSTATATNRLQSFGNFIVNLPSLSGTLSFWTSSTTAEIKGNLTITSTNTGTFRALTSGSITINGNLVINGGKFQHASGAASFNVLGNTTIASGATLDLSAGTGTFSQRGTTFTNNGTLIGGGSTTAGGTLAFYSPSNTAMTFDGSGTVSSALTAFSLQTTGGLTISHSNQIPVLRTNLFAGTVTNSNKITMGTGAALAVTFQTGSAGSTLNGGTFDQSPTWNLGTGTYSLIYSQELGNRTTGFEIPSTRTVNNITNSNSNGITISGGALSSAALTFSSGCGNITTSSTNVLTITGTATSAITRTSTTAYVNGPLELTLPASLVSGSTYLFPIGKTTLYPFELVNPTTNSGGAVVVRAEVFDGNSGGTAGNLIATLSSSRYWAASISSGSANLTNTNIRLTDASTTGFDAIANSATQTGAYGIVGGTTSTVTSTTILSITPLTSISGFYVMGSKSAATLATPSITPSGNQCTNVSRAISVVVTPGGAAVTSVALNYSINGTAQTAIAMTNTTNTGGADTWTATIPTVTPSNASITWSITATDANSLTRTVTGVGYQDNPNLGVTATASATPSSVCPGSNTSLNFVFGNSATAPSSYCSINAATNTSSYFDMFSTTGADLNITNNSTGFSTGGYGNFTNQVVKANRNTTINFSTTLIGTTVGVALWVDWNQNSTFETSERMYVTSGYVSSASGSFVVPNTASYGYTRMRILMDYNTSIPANPCAISSSGRGEVEDYLFYVAPIASAISWSNGSSVIGTNNPLTTTVSSSTTYTGTATVNNCPVTASGITPTIINPLTSAPSSSSYIFGATTNTDFNTAANWYTYSSANGYTIASALPTSSDNIIIAASATCIKALPSLSTTTTTGSIEIQSGAVLSLNGNALSIAGALTGTGTIKGSSNSSLSITSSSNSTLNIDQTTSGTTNVMKNLTLSGTGNTTLSNALNIATGATPGVLTVNTGATLTTGGFLTLKSDATGTARVANSAGTISGEVSVERYIPQNSNRAWRALAVPTYSASQTIANSWQLGTLITGPGGANGLDQSTGGYSMMSYDPTTDALVGVGNMSNVISGNTAAPAAYYLYVRGDRNTGVANTNLNPTATTLSSKGSLYQGTVTVTAANNGSGTTYHLLGNPYVSPINLNSFYTANSSNIDNTFYLFDPQIANTTAGVGGLITLTGSGSSYTPSVTGASYSGSISEIPSGMAFFITKSSGSASSIVFNESMKTTGSTISNGYNGLKTTAAVDGQLQVNLNVKINDSIVRPADGILAIFDANEKVQVDGADARKMSNFGENMSINNHGDLLAIEKRPLFNQDTLHINTTGLTNRLYSLRFNPSQFQNASSALLIDHYTHSTQSIPLQSVSEYAFTIDANAQSKGPNRFDVVFEQAALQIATTKKLMAIELYPNPVSEGVINISMHQQKEGNYTVSIVNALGAEIQKENWHHSNGDQIHSINVNKLASGIYYLKISNEFGDQSMHKFIQSSSNF